MPEGFADPIFPIRISVSTANPYQKYSETQITTANQANLIVMMDDGTIRFTRQPLDSLDKNDPAAMAGNIQKSRDIVNELSVSLDVGQGKDAARRLESLYQFVLSQLTLANIKADRAPLETVLRVLTPLSEAWRAVAEGRANGTQPESFGPLSTHG
jgi:flagellar protein FliS